MHILVTAGPTREYFDTVRFISNPSSGKFGYALAAEARARGHQVTLVSGPVALTPPQGVRTIHVVSAAEMFQRCAEVFDRIDAAIMTAAVCDYRPTRCINHKLQKRARPRPITLVPTRDIAAHFGRTKGDRVLIAFAMEDHDHHSHAERKLAKKRCDAIVLNGPENVATDEATIEILRAGGAWSRPLRGSKIRIARTVIDLVEESAAAKQRG